MKHLLKFLFSTLLLTCVSGVFAQDKIMLNNGKLKEVYVLETTPYEVYYRNEKLHKKAIKNGWDEELKAKEKEMEDKFREETKDLKPEENADDKKKLENLRIRKSNELENLYARYTKKYDTENVFSITYASTGKEEVIYSPDTLGLLVIDSVRPEVEYTVPEMRHYIQGRIDGRRHKAPWATVGGAAAGVAGAYLGAFYGLLVPAAYVTIEGLSKVRIQEEHVSDPNLIMNQAYQDGYVKSARRKKLKNIILSSTVGFGVGLGAFLLIFHQ